MKVLIDILTPKQVMFFSRTAERLREKGHQVFEITREYKEVIQLLSLKGIKAQVVGKHGGKSVEGKLRASAERTVQLTAILSEMQPDVAISLSSPETSRVAFGLQIPHVCVNDSPHAEAVARLTIPLATRLLTPKVIPKEVWTRFGIASSRIIQYKALDAWAWLRNFKPDETVLTELGLDKSQPIVVFRTEESFASYLLGKTSKAPIWLPLIEDLLNRNTDLQVVLVPRYEDQINLLKEKLGKRVVTCESTIDGPSLLSFASVFIGAGGTMTTEAALLGTPAFSCYPDKPFIVEKYLVKKGLIKRETNLKKLRNEISATIRNADQARSVQIRTARRLTETFEDPIEVIVKAAEKVV